VTFIAEHTECVEGGLRWGVEPICRVLSQHGCPIAPSSYYAARAAERRPAPRARRDEQLRQEVLRVHAANYGVYGARKVWLALNREGVRVARCTVERLMRELGLVGARRGRCHRTTMAQAGVAQAGVAQAGVTRPADRVQRRFNPPAPNRTWVADFTYVPTWSGMVYVAFVIDAYSRRILGWRAATSMRTALVLDALEQAVWQRRRDGIDDLSGLVHHTDAGAQYTSIAFTQRLTLAGIDASVGSVGDAYDNALAESLIGLFKTELIKPRAPWRSVEQVEIATLEYVDWFNHRRPFTVCGDVPPAELEAAHYRHTNHPTEAGHTHP
jgi:putative transposase